MLIYLSEGRSKNFRSFSCTFVRSWLTFLSCTFVPFRVLRHGSYRTVTFSTVNPILSDRVLYFLSVSCTLVPFRFIAYVDIYQKGQKEDLKKPIPPVRTPNPQKSALKDNMEEYSAFPTRPPKHPGQTSPSSGRRLSGIPRRNSENTPTSTSICTGCPKIVWDPF